MYLAIAKWRKEGEGEERRGKREERSWEREKLASRKGRVLERNCSGCPSPTDGSDGVWEIGRRRRARDTLRRNCHILARLAVMTVHRKKRNSEHVSRWDWTMCVLRNAKLTILRSTHSSIRAQPLKGMGLCFTLDKWRFVQPSDKYWKDVFIWSMVYWDPYLARHIKTREWKQSHMW